ncbi:MAG: hypothetical protein JXB05_01760 [Myxococcaceae bacterium]|nr:hypothetical protein [Myxococcaceae bacterium]
MRRRILVVLLALGTVGGYASGIASLRYRSHCRRAWTEARTSQACPPCASTTAQAPTPSSPR